MLDLIYQYYTAEKSAAEYTIPVGIVFVVIGFLFWQFLSENQISKGLGLGLMIAGVLIISILLANRQYNIKMIDGLSNRKLEQTEQLKQTEINRMEKVMNVSFKYAFISFFVLIILLTGAMLFSRSYYWKGMSLAFLLFVLVLAIADTYNSKRNQEYLQTLEQPKK